MLNVQLEGFLLLCVYTHNHLPDQNIEHFLSSLEASIMPL